MAGGRLWPPRISALAGAAHAAQRAVAVPGLQGLSRLSEAEQRSLLKQLFACDMPYASPTGRATLVKMPVEELDQRFEA